MRDKINKIVGNVLKNYDWKIDFGYDCIRVTVIFKGLFTDIPLSDIKTLGEELDTGYDVWLTLEDGNIQLNYDITNLINREFNNDWKAYEDKYFQS